MVKIDILKSISKSNHLAGEYLGKCFDLLMKKSLPKPPRTWSRFAIDDSDWYEMLHEQEYWRKWHQLKKLKEQQFLKKKEQGDEIIYELTEQGQALLLQEQISKIKNKHPKNTRCFVVFDIPEPARNTRELLRKMLKKCKFTMVQQSVWASQYRVERMLHELFELTGLSKWAKIFVGRCIV